MRGWGLSEPLQRVLEGWAEENGRSDLLVPAEFNHELFPLASTAMDPTENLLSFTLKTVQSDGRLVERTLEVEGSPRLGLPGLFDQEVYAGVLALLERQGGIYLADSEEYAVGEGYNIWSFRWAKDSRPGRAKTELNELKFHEYFIRNYQAGYIKSIDWDFWLSLGRGTRGGTLKRLYRLIDAQRAGTLEWRTTVPNLMAQVPVPPSYKYPGKARDYLKRHHPDLVKRGFLKDVEISADYEVLYGVDEPFVNRQRHLGLAEDPRDRSAIERLMSFKVRENVARNLVAMRGAALCRRYMDAVPHQKDVRRPAGWLKTYIEGDHKGSYPPKHGFAPASADASARPAVLPKAARPSVAPKDHKEGYEWLFGEDDPAVEPSPPTTDEAGWAEAISAAEAVQRRRRSGESDQTIRNLETLPYEGYTKWVAAPSPVVDASGTKFFVSADADFFVYVGGDGPAHRVL